MLKNNKTLILIIKTSLPPAISMIIQSLYNIIDSMYVTSFDDKAMKAISIVYPIQNIILAIAVGLGVGLNAYISMKLGQKKIEDASKAATQSLFLCLIHYILVLAIGLGVSTLFINSFTQDSLVFDYASTYITWIIIFSFATIFQINFEKILQADGKMILPMYSLLAGVIINIILDPILIFNCNLGVLGAAIATVIAQIVSAVIMLYFVLSRHNRIRLSFKGFKFKKDSFLAIYRVGIPAFAMNAIPSVMVTSMNYILVKVSETAITTFGIYYKLQYFVYMGICGISQGTMPMMSYSFGSDDKEQLTSILKNSIKLSVVICFIATLFFLAIPNILMMAFYKDAKMIESTTILLRVASLGFCFGSINAFMPSYFQSIQKGIPSLIISICRQIVILLPLAYFLQMALNETGIYLAVAISELLTFILVVILYKLTKTKEKSL